MEDCVCSRSSTAVGGTLLVLMYEAKGVLGVQPLTTLTSANSGVIVQVS